MPFDSENVSNIVLYWVVLKVVSRSVFRYSYKDAFNLCYYENMPRGTFCFSQLSKLANMLEHH